MVGICQREGKVKRPTRNSDVEKGKKLKSYCRSMKADKNLKVVWEVYGVMNLSRKYEDNEKRQRQQRQ